MDKKTKNLKALEEIRRLEPNWNGCGAPALPDALVERCIAIIESLSIQPDVHPTHQESVHFEFDLEDGSFAEFEVFEGRVDLHLEYDEGTLQRTFSHEEMNWNVLLNSFQLLYT